jgi:hypothetical protein
MSGPRLGALSNNRWSGGTLSFCAPCYRSSRGYPVAEVLCACLGCSGYLKDAMRNWRRGGGSDSVWSTVTWWTCDWNDGWGRRVRHDSVMDGPGSFLFFFIWPNVGGVFRNPWWKFTYFAICRCCHTWRERAESKGIFARYSMERANVWAFFSGADKCQEKATGRDKSCFACARACLPRYGWTRENKKKRRKEKKKSWCVFGEEK